MELATLRFLESAPAALAVGLMLLPRLMGEEGARFKPAVALLALARAVFGLFLIAAIARSIIPPQKTIDLPTLVDFALGTVVGKAWLATQIAALIFAAIAALRATLRSKWLESAALWSGVAVIAMVSVTGHAIDDSLPSYTRISFLIHTLAGLTWLGGLLGLVWWMLTARNQPPEVARRLAERWSLVAKIAMAVVVLSGGALAWENVASFPNLLATAYGRLLALKLAILCAVLLIALALARYLTRDAGPSFQFKWYGYTGAVEAALGLALLFLAGWIATITPGSHETDLYWPLPFRVSYAATWGYKVPAWTDTWWWGIATLGASVTAAATWWTPYLRNWRRFVTPVPAIAAFVCLIVSMSVQAYPDTYLDPAEPYTAESIGRGYDIFQTNCVACHGPMGEANGPLAKDLKAPPADLTAPHVATHTLGDIFHWLTFGGQSGIMPAFGEQLTPDDRWDVINFLIILSSTNQSRFLGPKGVIQWLVAPDLALADPKEELTTLEKLRGTPVLISFADCRNASSTAADRVASLNLASGAASRRNASDTAAGLIASLNLASEAASAVGARHVTVYRGDCPSDAKGVAPVHPKAVEVAFSVLNRYLDEPFVVEIPEGHFLVDRSGYIRARFRHFAADDGSVTQLRAQIALTASEPVVPITNFHAH